MTDQRCKQIEARLELYRRFKQALDHLDGSWGRRTEYDPLPLNTPAHTRTLFNEALELLTRLQAFADRDVDAAIRP